MDSSPTVRVDPDARLHQGARARRTGEPRARVRVEDRRLTPLRRLVQTLRTKPSLQGVGESPRQHHAVVSVQNCRRLDEPAEAPKACHVGVPEAIGAGHRHPARQLGIEAVIRIGLRRRRFGFDRHPPHPLHEVGQALAMLRLAPGRDIAVIRQLPYDQRSTASHIYRALSPSSH